MRCIYLVLFVNLITFFLNIDFDKNIVYNIGVPNNKDMANSSEKNNQMSFWSVGIYLFGRLLIWLCIPIVVAYLIGTYLDHRYNTEPLWFLILLGIAFIISNIGIIKEAMQAMRLLDQEGQSHKK